MSQKKSKKSARKKVSSKKKKTTASKAELQAYRSPMYAEIHKIKNSLKDLKNENEDLKDRVGDLELNLNLLTRLLTTLCIEKFGMRVGVLKRLIREAEKEVIRDSQIMQLESLYELPSRGNKKKNNPPERDDDSWEELS